MFNQTHGSNPRHFGQAPQELASHVKLLMGFIWLRNGTSCGLFCTGKQNFRTPWHSVISWPEVLLVVSLNRTLPSRWLLGITANKQFSSSLVRRSKWPCIFQDCRYMAIFVILIWWETKVWSRKVNFGAALTRSFKQLIMQPLIYSTTFTVITKSMSHFVYSSSILLYFRIL